MRTIVQALSLVLFTLLFLWTNWKLPDWLPADMHLRLYPVLGLSAVLAGREIVNRGLWSFRPHRGRTARRSVLLRLCPSPRGRD